MSDFQTLYHKLRILCSTLRNYVYAYSFIIVKIVSSLCCSTPLHYNEEYFCIILQHTLALYCRTLLHYNEAHSCIMLQVCRPKRQIRKTVQDARFSNKPLVQSPFADFALPITNPLWVTAFLDTHQYLPTTFECLSALRQTYCTQSRLQYPKALACPRCSFPA